jgi:hypothetical protein
MTSSTQKVWRKSVILRNSSDRFLHGLPLKLFEHSLPSPGDLQAVVNLRAVSFAKYSNWVALRGGIVTIPWCIAANFFSIVNFACGRRNNWEFSSNFFSLKITKVSKVFINNMFLGIEIYYINIFQFWYIGTWVHTLYQLFLSIFYYIDE